jgi:4-amino-4-deoxy-L-arabinose transferase-like glycosyltransferase
MIFKKINTPNGSKNKTSFFFVTIFLFIGVFFRVFFISEIPSGLNQDEASIGYEAFSIMTTGQDRAGNSYPIHLKSWGSGQNALYAYFSIPFIHFFGLNSLSIRLVNCIFSCISLLIFYLLFKLTTDKKTATIALVLIAICPWSIMAGRWALKSNIFPILFLLAVYFLIKGFKVSSQNYYFSFSLFALSLYSYGTSYLIVPLFFIFIIPYLIKNKLISPSRVMLNLFVFITIAAPIVIFVLINHLDLNEFRIGEITIPKLESNRTTVVFNLFSDNPIISLIKNFVRLIYIIILQTDNTTYNSIPSSGTIYHLSLPFFLIGIFNVVIRKPFANNPSHFIFFAWFICSLILGISSHVNINRINIIFFPILYFTVFGIVEFRNFLKPKLKKYFYPTLITIYFMLFFSFVCNYFFVFNKEVKNNFAFGLEEALDYAEKKISKKPLYISSRTVNMPYIYISFYTSMDANKFRNEVVYGKNNNGFIEVLSLGKYEFGDELVRDNNINLIKESDMKHIQNECTDLLKFGNFYLCNLCNN